LLFAAGSAGLTTSQIAIDGWKWASTSFINENWSSTKEDLYEKAWDVI
jgi:hypothetical protein